MILQSENKSGLESVNSLEADSVSEAEGQTFGVTFVVGQ